MEEEGVVDEQPGSRPISSKSAMSAKSSSRPGTSASRPGTSKSEGLRSR